MNPEYIIDNNNDEWSISEWHGRWCVVHAPHDSNRPALSVLARVPDYGSRAEAVAAIMSGTHPRR
jgi:hypothetical protein